VYADYKTEIIFAVFEETLLTCYGYRLTLGPFCRFQNWPSSLFALAFPNKIKHRFVNARINYYIDASTSCEILVKIGAVTSEFKRAKNENLPQLDWNLTIIVHLARWRSETDWSIKIFFWFQQNNRQSFLYIYSTQYHGIAMISVC